MIENWKLYAALSLSALGNCIAWFHMNAQFRWEWAKSQWFILLVGIPISYLFYYSTRFSYEYFGYVWNIRMIGFGLGNLVFGLLTWAILSEVPSPRIIISLLLALTIILINVK